MAGVIYAGALYFRDRFNRTYGTPLATFLGVLRFACVSLLCLFLLKPLIKTIEREVEKPIIVIILNLVAIKIDKIQIRVHLQKYQHNLWRQLVKLSFAVVVVNT